MPVPLSPLPLPIFLHFPYYRSTAEPQPTEWLARSFSRVRFTASLPPRGVCFARAEKISAAGHSPSGREQHNWQECVVQIVAARHVSALAERDQVHRRGSTPGSAGTDPEWECEVPTHQPSVSTQRGNPATQRTHISSTWSGEHPPKGKNCAYRGGTLNLDHFNFC